MNLATRLLPNTCGILWFTEGPLSQRPPAFNELDYFLDGLLTNIVLKEQKNDSRKHFLTTTHFGRPFFLAHFQSGNDGASLKSDVKEVFELALKLRLDRPSLIVIGNHLERLQNDLKIFSKDFEVELIKG